MANKIWVYLSFHSFFLHIRDFIDCPGFSLILKKGENRSIKEIGLHLWREVISKIPDMN
jgi:hypothetical protein